MIRLLGDPTEVALLSNRFVVGGIVVEIVIILLIVYTDLGNALFGTAPVTSQVWLFATPFAIAMLVLEEGRKWLVRHHTLEPRASWRNSRHRAARLWTLEPLPHAPSLSEGGGFSLSRSRFFSRRRAGAQSAPHRRTASDPQPLRTGIFFSLALTSGGLGTVTVSTPLANAAST